MLTNQDQLRSAWSVVKRAREHADRSATLGEVERLGRAAVAGMLAPDLALQQKLNAIDALDRLSDYDFDLLKAFSGRTRQVDLLPQAGSFDKLTLVNTSIMKLVSRGLIAETASSGFSTTSASGDADRWENRLKNRYYEIMPLGDLVAHLVTGSPLPAPARSVFTTPATT